MRNILIFVILLFVSINASAENISTGEISIDYVQVQDDNRVYVQTIPAATTWQGACTKGFALRVDDIDAVGFQNRALSILLSAKMANKKVVIFLNNDTGCYVPRIKRITVK